MGWFSFYWLMRGMPLLAIMSGGPEPAGNGIDPTIFVAIVATGISVVVALISVGIAVYQKRYIGMLEREKRALQDEISRLRGTGDVVGEQV